MCGCLGHRMVKNAEVIIRVYALDSGSGYKGSQGSGFPLSDSNDVSG